MQLYDRPGTVTFVVGFDAPPEVGDVLVVEMKGEPDRVLRFPLRFDDPQSLAMAITLPVPPPPKAAASDDGHPKDSGPK